MKFLLASAAVVLAVQSVPAQAGAFNLESRGEDESTCTTNINSEFNKRYKPHGCTITNTIIDFSGRFDVTCVAVVTCKYL